MEEKMNADEISSVGITQEGTSSQTPQLKAVESQPTLLGEKEQLYECLLYHVNPPGKGSDVALIGNMSTKICPTVNSELFGCDISSINTDKSGRLRVFLKGKLRKPSPHTIRETHPGISRVWWVHHEDTIPPYTTPIPPHLRKLGQ
jgi:hypothetical protein